MVNLFVFAVAYGIASLSPLLCFALIEEPYSVGFYGNFPLAGDWQTGSGQVEIRLLEISEHSCVFEE